MKRFSAALLALALAGNGMVMLLAGPWWYGAVPGVTGTGPFNPHFVKDIGAAYLTAGLGFAWLALRPASSSAGAAAAYGAAAAGTVFLTLHAAIHLIEAAWSPSGLSDLARDAPGVILPALAGAFVVWRAPPRPELSHA